MKDVKLSVGRKVFSFKCDERDVDKLNELSNDLNKIVNSNIVKYRGLSEDNVFLLTAFELLDGNKEVKKETVIEKQIIKEEVVKKIPNLYHPYPNVVGDSWSIDLFGQNVNDDSQALDNIIDKQNQIDREMEVIYSYLNAMIVALVNHDK